MKIIFVLITFMERCQNRIGNYYCSELKTQSQMIKIVDEQSNHSSEEQYFHTIREAILPPNQIIKKHYEPDKNPTLKLLSSQERKVYQISTDKSTDSKDHLFNYKVDFDDEDSLGYHYGDKIKKSLVYAKFDNRFFMNPPSAKSKYLASFFIPLTTFLKPDIKIHRNLYKSLQQTHKFSYVDYSDKIQHSFGPNCFTKEGQIKFSSNYQSSNLFMVTKVIEYEIQTGPFQYDLILQNDINSKGTTQWFNFAVQIPEAACYKFKIVNLTKSHSLFEKGMQIPYFSFQENIEHGTGWKRGCQNITYQRSSITRQSSCESYYFNLHFEFNNQYKNDTVIFSYCFPYTGLDMEKFFSKITQKKMSNSLMIQKVKICETLSFLPLYAYHIFPKKNVYSLHNLHRSNLSVFQRKSANHDPKGIVFLARQHPGQSQSSFILEGILDFLLQSNQFDNLKRNFHFYIFPMINVDGVYYGNYRTNLSGNDLNRVWKQPRKDFHPEIYWTKKYLHTVNKITELKLIVDIHGHSSALNSFFYGNPHKKQGVNGADNPKLFPYFCSKQMKQISFLQSTFNISEDKKGSARVVLNQIFPKASVYTLQNSFFGYKKGKRIIEYTIEKYRKVGRSLISSYFEYCKIVQRLPLIKQKWEKQIYNLLEGLKNLSHVQNPSDSDSEAPKQLIQFDHEFQIIDKNKSLKLNDEKENEKTFGNFKGFYENGKYSNQRMFGLHNKLYDRKRTKYQKTEQERKINAISGLYFQDLCQTNQEAMTTQLGFLSIVKIETKKSQSDKKDILTIETNEEKQSGFSQQKELNNHKSQNLSSPKNNGLSSTTFLRKSDKMFKKQYTVRALKQQKYLQGQMREFKYVNEKQFLLRRRKSQNNSAKLNTSQLPSADSMMQM